MFKHIIIALFEAFETSRPTSTRNLQDLLNNMAFKKIKIVYVKDEDANLNTMTFALKLVMSCETLGVMKSFQGSCFAHAFSKAYQYTTIEERIFRGLKYVSIIFSQKKLQICITWLKKSRKQNMNG